MLEKIPYEKIMRLIDPHKEVEKGWFLDLLDEDLQASYEHEHMQAVMWALRLWRIRPHKKAIREAQNRIQELEKEKNTAENYREILQLNAEIAREKEKMEAYRPFFDEPYFARMDLIDDKENFSLKMLCFILPFSER